MILQHNVGCMTVLLNFTNPLNEPQPQTTLEQRAPPFTQRMQSETETYGLADSVIASTTSRSPKNKDGRKTPLKTSKHVPVFDEQWESHMKTQISQDVHLHMRVLRFEVRASEPQIP
jgi:hypothetical protein